MEDNQHILPPQSMEQQLQAEKNKYRAALEQDREFHILKDIRLRIKQLEDKIKEEANRND